MLPKKATKINEIFTVNLTLCSKCQIDSEDFVKYCGLLRKHELYLAIIWQFSCILSFGNLPILPQKYLESMSAYRFVEMLPFIQDF